MEFKVGDVVLHNEADWKGVVTDLDDPKGGGLVRVNWGSAGVFWYGNTQRSHNDIERIRLSTPLDYLL